MEDAAAVAARLAAHGAVLFGANKCQYTTQMRALLGIAGGGGGEGDAIPYVACDSGPESAALCERVGITMTPTLVFAGTAVKGATSLAGLRDLVAVAPRLANTLAERHAVLYGRAGCDWTARQTKVLGLSADRVPYVDCDATPARCKADGIAAVPAWRIDGSAPIYGYRRLPELTTLAAGDAAALAAAASASAAAVAAGAAAATVK